MNKMTVRDLSFAGRRILLRVDFNVPLDGATVADDTRIRAAIPTIEYILAQKPRSLVLLSHLGRPKGKRLAELSLAPVAPVLAKYLDLDVAFADDCIGSSTVDSMIAATCHAPASFSWKIRAFMLAKPRTIQTSPAN